MHSQAARRRLAVGLAYDGGGFIGWQRQNKGRSVQGEVERALGIVADEPISVVAAGRTDAGVHAAGQVLHFDTTSLCSVRNWVLGANRHLPADVALRWAREVPDDFHARFSATARRYCYFIRESAVRPVLERARCAWSRETLDLAAMQTAAAWLVGEHDFSAFRAAGCQAHTPRRSMHRLDLRRTNGLLQVEAEANAFLQHMVRNIVGSLIRVGRGKAGPEWMREVLASRDRRRAGAAAPARGLVLAGIEYPARFDLPSTSVGVEERPLEL